MTAIKFFIANHKIPIFIWFVSVLSVLVEHPTVLFYPPYWDGVTAVFKEALFLLDHNWDYYHLAFHEEGYRAGGSRTYFLSIYPFFVSLLFAVVENPRVIFAILKLVHVAEFLALLIAIYQLARLLRLPPRQQFLVVAIVGFYPLILGQVFAMNAELDIALCAVCAFASFFRSQVSRAFFWSLLAVLFKGNGAFVGLTLAIGSTVWAVIDRKSLWRGSVFLIPPLVFFALILAERFWFFKGGADGQFIFPWVLGPSEFVNSVNDSTRFILSCLPDIYIGFLIIICLFGLNLRNRFNQLREEFYLTLAAILVWLSFLHFSLNLPRYLVSILPIGILVFGCMLHKLSPAFAKWIMISVLVCAVINRNGSLYRWFGFNQKSRNGDTQESTLDYLNSIKDDMRFANRISEMPKEYLFATSWPFSILMREPRMGYVSEKDSRVMSCFRTNEKCCDPCSDKRCVWVDTNDCFSIRPPNCQMIVLERY